ncbi:MAG: HNH endonuclease [Acidimicrobiia bacterium]|nr:HNH endonuclease [Acidimicrobiia bacterium]
MTAPGGDPAAASRPAPPARRRTPDRYKIVVRADLDALVRGTVAGDETCEIAGVGPVAVTAIRDLLGQATLHLVLTKGSAVANVTHLGRGPAAAQRIALLWQAPTCTRLGCPRRAHLQIDHRTPWADCHVTELANLDPLCGADHALKTRRGWALVSGTGRRPMVPPDHPDHPRGRPP